MPRVFLFNEAMQVVYSVDQTVGQGAANLREDVLLVQFFLRVLMEDRNGESFRPPGERPITIDGAFGKQTNTYIKFFEEQLTRFNPGNPVVKDGKIEPMSPGSGGLGTVTGAVFKIGRLNFEHLKRRGFAIHNDVKKDPLFPPALLPSLYV